jgi:hypothetical protein
MLPSVIGGPADCYVLPLTNQVQDAGKFDFLWFDRFILTVMLEITLY